MLLQVAVGVASDSHVTGHVIPVLADAEGATQWSGPCSQQQSLRAGSDSHGSDASKKVERKSQCTEEDDDGCGCGEHSLKPKPPAAAKTFSYAQVLKTSLSDSWTSSRSHTPSEGSLAVDTRTPTPVNMLLQTPPQTSPLDSNTHSPNQSSEVASTPEHNHLNASLDRLHASPDLSSMPMLSPAQLEPTVNEEDETSSHTSPQAVVAASESVDSPKSVEVCSSQDRAEISTSPDHSMAVNEKGRELPTDTAAALMPSLHVVSDDSTDLPPAPPPPTNVVSVSAPSSTTCADLPKATPTPLPVTVRFPQPRVQTDQLLQKQGSILVPPQDHIQTQKPWAHPVQLPSQQLHSEQRVASGPNPLVHTHQHHRQGNIPVPQQHMQHNPHLQQLQLQQHLQLKQPQLQHLLLQVQKQQLYQQQQQQVQYHRLQPQQRHRYPEPASVTRLPTPQRPLPLLTSRPLMTAPAPRVLPTPSHLHPMLLQLQQAFQQPQHIALKSHQMIPMQQQNSELLKSEPPGLPKTRTAHYHVHDMAGKQLVIGATSESASTYPSGGRSREVSQPTGSSQETVSVAEKREGGNGDLKTRLSVTASPFIPGGNSDQQATPTPPLKKISPPLVEGPPHPRHPPGFDHAQVPRPFLLQPAILPTQALAAVRPLTTIPAAPIASHPPLALSLPVAALRMQQQQQQQPLTKTIHLPAHTTRQASVPTRPVPFYQYHQTSHGDTLIRHDPAHHTKVPPSDPPPVQGHALLDQPKLLQSSMLPHGGGGLMPNPFTAGVTFVPPVAVPPLPLTTPTPSPSSQALPLTKSSSALQAKKALLPTPTTIATHHPGIALSTPSATTVPGRLSHGQEQQLQHSY